MEAATCSQRLGFFSPIDSEKATRKSNGFVSLSRRSNKKDQRIRLCNSRTSPKLGNFKLSCCAKNARAIDSEQSYALVEEPLILQKKSQEIAPYLSGRCIYLVGMMGSGKTTVGKILSEVLGYSFFDSDKLVEQAVGGTSVAQIFKQFSESFFRDNETKVLQELSTMRCQVVATGGGAVIRPINWKYMKNGITVWLDVPLEALARRIAAVGTNSRPLLHDESGDAYTKALHRLSSLYDERGEAYANADATVSLEHAAAKLDLLDVSDLTPTAIATEVLVQIENFLKGDNGMMGIGRS
ncbi:hypothetical protein Scep_000883 [Stephania cephalantha]|uniref:shikimate kinase n=1 Tax=Stephania cephalantha TaxID=152367 RepID=A0AAP0L8F6_9MAGN